MLATFFHRVLFSWVAFCVLSVACFLGRASAQRETTPAPSEQKSAQSDKSSETEKQDTKTVDESEKRNDKSKTAKEKAPVKKQIRSIALSGSYDDMTQPPVLDPTALLLGATPPKSKSFYRLCDYLQELGDDANVVYVLFDLSDTALGMNSAQLDELARRLAVLKSKGKKLLAWLETADNVHLAIASNCDEIIMADFGAVDMPSSALETMFYRDALDLIGVKASVVRAGDFKGAVEPYVNHAMSEHLKSHYMSMIESINASQVSRIAKGRGLTNAAVRSLQKKRMLLPAEALAANLVTKLAPYGSMKNTVQEMIGKDIEWTTPKSKPKREMSFFEFMSKAMAGPKDTARVREDTIAVLHLSGAIVDGKEVSPGEIVAGPMVKTIQDLMNEERVRGVVVRINSPGGSATASEAIRQALEELAKKKPVVFSMGEMAASGGYWVTCIGQPIYAERGTITGSIGVFSLKLSLGSMLRRIGVHVESVTLDDSAAFNSIDRAWSDDDIANMQRFIDEVYDRFLKIASQSRNIPIDKLASLAGGRVWSGEQAKQNGLIDEIGGLDDCLAVIAKKSQIEKYKVLHRPDPPSGFDLFRMFDEPTETDIQIQKPNLFQSLEKQLGMVLGENRFSLKATKALLRSALGSSGSKSAIWALMPHEVRVR